MLYSIFFVKRIQNVVKQNKPDQFRGDIYIIYPTRFILRTVQNAYFCVKRIRQH